LNFETIDPTQRPSALSWNEVDPKFGSGAFLTRPAVMLRALRKRRAQHYRIIRRYWLVFLRSIGVMVYSVNLVHSFGGKSTDTDMP
jgi:hypothetical protein